MSILTPFQEKNMEKLSISQTVHALTEKTCQAESVLEEKVSGACAVTCTGSESAAREAQLEMDNKYQQGYNHPDTWTLGHIQSRIKFSLEQNKWGRRNYD